MCIPKFFSQKWQSSTWWCASPLKSSPALHVSSRQGHTSYIDENQHFIFLSFCQILIAGHLKLDLNWKWNLIAIKKDIFKRLACWSATWPTMSFPILAAQTGHICKKIQTNTNQLAPSCSALDDYHYMILQESI
jgi:hypothetical protein